MLGAARGCVASHTQARRGLNHCMAMRRRVLALPLGVVVSTALAGCSITSTPPGPSSIGFASLSSSFAITLQSGVARLPFNVGTAVTGAPDPHNAQFLAD